MNGPRYFLQDLVLFSCGDWVWLGDQRARGLGYRQDFRNQQGCFYQNINSTRSKAMRLACRNAPITPASRTKTNTISNAKGRFLIAVKKRLGWFKGAPYWRSVLNCMKMAYLAPSHSILKQDGNGSGQPGEPPSLVTKSAIDCGCKTQRYFGVR
jgi:hypothetical protein